MRTLKPCYLAILLFLSASLAAQQKVDLAALDDAYKGGFLRISVGLGNGKASYTDVLDKESVAPLQFQIIGGKRLNRIVAPYFNVYGNTLLKATSRLAQYNVSGMGLGTDLFVFGPNTYIAPEIGMAVMLLEEAGGNDYTDNLGVNMTLRFGRDMFLGGKAFVGVQFWASYFRAADMDDSYMKGNGTLIGISVSFKHGK